MLPILALISIANRKTSNTNRSQSQTLYHLISDSTDQRNPKPHRMKRFSRYMHTKPLGQRLLEYFPNAPLTNRPHNLSQQYQLNPSYPKSPPPINPLQITSKQPEQPIITFLPTKRTQNFRQILSSFFRPTHEGLPTKITLRFDP